MAGILFAGILLVFPQRTGTHHSLPQGRTQTLVHRQQFTLHCLCGRHSNRRLRRPYHHPTHRTAARTLARRNRHQPQRLHPHRRAHGRAHHRRILLHGAGRLTDPRHHPLRPLRPARRITRGGARRIQRHRLTRLHRRPAHGRVDSPHGRRLEDGFRHSRPASDLALAWIWQRSPAATHRPQSGFSLRWAVSAPFVLGLLDRNRPRRLSRVLHDLLERRLSREQPAHAACECRAICQPFPDRHDHRTPNRQPACSTLRRASRGHRLHRSRRHRLRRILDNEHNYHRASRTLHHGLGRRRLISAAAFDGNGRGAK